MAAVDPEFGPVLNSFDLVTTGRPAGAVGAQPAAPRGSARPCLGPNLMRAVCAAARAEDLRIYLYGSRADVLTALQSRLTTSFPGLRIAGSCSPPFRRATEAEDAQQVDAILSSGANIVFVGLGCPRQERWAAEHRARLSMPLVCVGAAFDFHAGTLPQAPPWMQARGLEWLYRLAREPRRLWRRYAKHIPIFVTLVTWQLLALQFTRLVRGRSAAATPSETRT